MQTPGLKTACGLAVIATMSLSSSALAQSSGDVGGPPQNARQCHRFLASVDHALVWENKRYAKVFAKLDKKRTALKARFASLTAGQAADQARMDALQAALEDEANPPSDEDGARMVDEYNALAQTYADNGRKLQTVTDTLEGLKFDFSEAKKLHRSNVRNTVKYRRQVAAYCKRF